MKMHTKLLLILLLIALYVLPTANSWGVTKSLPYDLELLPGEQGTFKFQIQLVPTESEQECSYQVKEGFPLKISFEQGSVIIQPGNRKDVIGFVTAPKDIPYSGYAGEICVTCSGIVGQSGTSVNQFVCNNFEVSVVESRTRDNMYIPAEQKPEVNLPLLFAGIIIIIIAIVIFVLIMYKKKK